MSLIIVSFISLCKTVKEVERKEGRKEGGRERGRKRWTVREKERKGK